MLIVFSAIFAISIALLLSRAVRQQRLYRSIETVSAKSLIDQPQLTVIIPARNEAQNIAACLAGLSRQEYPKARFRVIVVDDNSTDDTEAAVRRFEKADMDVTLIRAGRLPPGWKGKPFACWCGAVLAVGAQWLCFIDADTIAEPALLCSALDTARRQGLDMLSLEPSQELDGFFDRLIIPLGLLSIAATQDLARINRLDAPEAAANGQFILIRTESYVALGGHAAVAGAICEDSALARRVKQAGMRFALLGAEQLMCAHMYADGPALWEGLSKNVTETFGGMRRTAAIAVAALLLGSGALILPFWSLVAVLGGAWPDAPIALILATAGSVALFATGLALARHFRIPAWYGILMPLGMLAGTLIAGHGIVCRMRRRIAWKGRIYASQE